MSLLPIIFISVCVAAGLFLILSVFLSPGTPEKTTYTNRGTRIFLVLLRLVIGWHFLVEGFEKYNDPSWTSQPYLHAATGPLGSHFREVADKQFLTDLEVTKETTKVKEKGKDTDKTTYKLSPSLQQKWQRWYDQFQEKILTEAIRLRGDTLKGKIKEITDNRAVYELRYRRQQKVQQLATALVFASTRRAGVAPAAAVLVPAKMETVDERLSRLKNELETHDKDIRAAAQAKFDKAKDRTAKWLGTKQDVRKPSPYFDRPTKMTADERVKYYQNLLAKVEKVAAENLSSFGDARQHELDVVWTEAQQFYGDLKVDMAVQTAAMKKDLQSVVPDPVMKRLTLPPMPAEPFTGNRLQIADLVVRWGLVIIGACLLLGLFTRINCVLGAGLLLAFFLAMPPLPGWPANPRAEGHYLYINKNIIEMVALLALATTGTGRWLGVDGLLRSVVSMFRRRS